MIAVLTADLIDSSSYDEKVLTRVLNTLKEEFSFINRVYGEGEVRWSIYRGDSFQVVINKPENALNIALQLKASINRIHLKETKKSKVYSKIADFKLAIGIGTLDLDREPISESNGQAFQFSGRALDEIKNDSRKTIIKTTIQDLDDELNTSLLLLDTITDRWSTASAEVVYFLIQGLKEREIATKLEISQSAVNQRKKAAGWEAISALLIRYYNLIEKNYLKA